jgi:hypothetical protein
MTTFPTLELRPTATILLQDPPDGGLATKTTQGADGTPVGTGAGAGGKGGFDFLTRTVGGIIGSVVEVKPDVIVLKIDENSNTKITVVRTKIEAVMKESTATE